MSPDVLLSQIQELKLIINEPNSPIKLDNALAYKKILTSLLDIITILKESSEETKKSLISNNSTYIALFEDILLNKKLLIISRNLSNVLVKFYYYHFQLLPNYLVKNYLTVLTKYFNNFTSNFANYSLTTSFSTLNPASEVTSSSTSFTSTASKVLNKELVLKILGLIIETKFAICINYMGDIFNLILKISKFSISDVILRLEGLKLLKVFIIQYIVKNNFVEHSQEILKIIFKSTTDKLIEIRAISCNLLQLMLKRNAFQFYPIEHFYSTAYKLLDDESNVVRNQAIYLTYSIYITQYQCFLNKKRDSDQNNSSNTTVSTPTNSSTFSSSLTRFTSLKFSNTKKVVDNSLDFSAILLINLKNLVKNNIKYSNRINNLIILFLLIKDYQFILLNNFNGDESSSETFKEDEFLEGQYATKDPSTLNFKSEYPLNINPNEPIYKLICNIVSLLQLNTPSYLNENGSSNSSPQMSFFYNFCFEEKSNFVLNLSYLFRKYFIFPLVQRGHTQVIIKIIKIFLHFVNFNKDLNEHILQFCLLEMNYLLLLTGQVTSPIIIDVINCANFYLKSNHYIVRTASSNLLETSAIICPDVSITIFNSSLDSLTLLIDTLIENKKDLDEGENEDIEEISKIFSEDSSKQGGSPKKKYNEKLSSFFSFHGQTLVISALLRNSEQLCTPIPHSSIKSVLKQGLEMISFASSSYRSSSTPNSTNHAVCSIVRAGGLIISSCLNQPQSSLFAIEFLPQIVEITSQLFKIGEISSSSPTPSSSISNSIDSALFEVLCIEPALVILTSLFNSPENFSIIIKKKNLINNLVESIEILLSNIQSNYLQKLKDQSNLNTLIILALEFFFFFPLNSFNSNFLNSLFNFYSNYLFSNCNSIMENNLASEFRKVKSKFSMNPNDDMDGEGSQATIAETTFNRLNELYISKINTDIIHYNSNQDCIIQNLLKDEEYKCECRKSSYNLIESTCFDLTSEFFYSDFEFLFNSINNFSIFNKKNNDLLFFNKQYNLNYAYINYLFHFHFYFNNFNSNSNPYYIGKNKEKFANFSSFSSISLTNFSNSYSVCNLRVNSSSFSSFNLESRLLDALIYLLAKLFPLQTTDIQSRLIQLASSNINSSLNNSICSSNASNTSQGSSINKLGSKFFSTSTVSPTSPSPSSTLSSLNNDEKKVLNKKNYNKIKNFVLLYYYIINYTPINQFCNDESYVSSTSSSFYTNNTVGSSSSPSSTSKSSTNDSCWQLILSESLTDLLSINDKYLNICCSNMFIKFSWKLQWKLNNNYINSFVAKVRSYFLSILASNSISSSSNSPPSLNSSLIAYNNSLSSLISNGSSIFHLTSTSLSSITSISSYNFLYTSINNIPPNFTPTAASNSNILASIPLIPLTSNEALQQSYLISLGYLSNIGIQFYLKNNEDIQEMKDIQTLVSMTLFDCFLLKLDSNFFVNIFYSFFFIIQSHIEEIQYVNDEYKKCIIDFRNSKNKNQQTFSSHYSNWIKNKKNIQGFNFEIVINFIEKLIEMIELNFSILNAYEDLSIYSSTLIKLLSLLFSLIFNLNTYFNLKIQIDSLNNTPNFPSPKFNYEKFPFIFRFLSFYNNIFEINLTLTNLKHLVNSLNVIIKSDYEGYFSLFYFMKVYKIYLFIQRNYFFSGISNNLNLNQTNFYLDPDFDTPISNTDSTYYDSLNSNPNNSNYINLTSPLCISTIFDFVSIVKVLFTFVPDLFMHKNFFITSLFEFYDYILNFFSNLNQFSQYGLEIKQNILINLNALNFNDKNFLLYNHTLDLIFSCFEDILKFDIDSLSKTGNKLDPKSFVFESISNETEIELIKETALAVYNSCINVLNGIQEDSSVNDLIRASNFSFSKKSHIEYSPRGIIYWLLYFRLIALGSISEKKNLIQETENNNNNDDPDNFFSSDSPIEASSSNCFHLIHSWSEYQQIYKDSIQKDTPTLSQVKLQLKIYSIYLSNYVFTLAQQKDIQFFSNIEESRQLLSNWLKYNNNKISKDKIFTAFSIMDLNQFKSNNLSDKSAYLILKNIDKSDSSHIFNSSVFSPSSISTFPLVFFIQDLVNSCCSLVNFQINDQVILPLQIQSMNLLSKLLHFYSGLMDPDSFVSLSEEDFNPKKLILFNNLSDFMNNSENSNFPKDLFKQFYYEINEGKIFFQYLSQILSSLRLTLASSSSLLLSSSYKILLLLLNHGFLRDKMTFQRLLKPLTSHQEYILTNWNSKQSENLNDFYYSLENLNLLKKFITINLLNKKKITYFMNFPSLSISNLLIKNDINTALVNLFYDNKFKYYEKFIFLINDAIKFLASFHWIESGSESIIESSNKSFDNTYSGPSCPTNNSYSISHFWLENHPNRGGFSFSSTYSDSNYLLMESSLILSSLSSVFLILLDEEIDTEKLSSTSFNNKIDSNGSLYDTLIAYFSLLFKFLSTIFSIYSNSPSFLSISPSNQYWIDFIHHPELLDELFYTFALLCKVIVNINDDIALLTLIDNFSHFLSNLSSIYSQHNIKLSSHYGTMLPLSAHSKYFLLQSFFILFNKFNGLKSLTLFNISLLSSVICAYFHSLSLICPVCFLNSSFNDEKLFFNLRLPQPNEYFNMVQKYLSSYPLGNDFSISGFDNSSTSFTLLNLNPSVFHQAAFSALIQTTNQFIQLLPLLSEANSSKIIPPHSVSFSLILSYKDIEAFLYSFLISMTILHSIECKRKKNFFTQVVNKKLSLDNSVLDSSEFLLIQSSLNKLNELNSSSTDSLPSFFNKSLEETMYQIFTSQVDSTIHSNIFESIYISLISLWNINSKYLSTDSISTKILTTLHIEYISSSSLSLITSFTFLLNTANSTFSDKFLRTLLTFVISSLVKDQSSLANSLDTQAIFRLKKLFQIILLLFSLNTINKLNFLNIFLLILSLGLKNFNSKNNDKLLSEVLILYGKCLNHFVGLNPAEFKTILTTFMNTNPNLGGEFFQLIQASMRQAILLQQQQEQLLQSRNQGGLKQPGLVLNIDKYK